MKSLYLSMIVALNPIVIAGNIAASEPACPTPSEHTWSSSAIATLWSVGTSKWTLGTIGTLGAACLHPQTRLSLALLASSIYNSHALAKLRVALATTSKSLEHLKSQLPAWFAKIETKQDGLKQGLDLVLSVQEAQLVSSEQTKEIAKVQHTCTCSRNENIEKKIKNAERQGRENAIKIIRGLRAKAAQEKEDAGGAIPEVTTANSQTSKPSNASWLHYVKAYIPRFSW